MKRIIFIVCIFIGFVAKGQFNPSIHTVINDAIGTPQAIPIDARSMYWDGVNFIYRPFQSTSEAFGYLVTSPNRFGNFIIVVDSGGTLQSNGTYINPHNTFYMFRDSTGNSGLQKMWLFGDFPNPVPQNVVDTIYRVNDSTLAFKQLNGNIGNVLLRGTSGGGISSLQMSTPTSLFSAPVIFANSSGAWTASLVLNNQGANTGFWGPASGSASSPTFRPMVVADLPSGIPNGNLLNSSIGFILGTSGTTPYFSASSASLGSNITLNVPFASNLNSGFLTNTDWIRFNTAVLMSVTSVNGQTGATVVKNADSIKSLPVDTTVDRNNYVLTFDSTDHKWYLAAPSAGSGGVSSVSSGNISNLATVSISNATTTPAFTFTPISESANLFYASPNGSSGNPSWRNIVSADFPTSGVTAGTYNSVTVNNKGIVTAASNVGTGITSLNSLTATTQLFSLGSSGTSPNISSVIATHTFNFPYASTSDTGIVIPSQVSYWNNKITTFTASGLSPLFGTTVGSGITTSLNFTLSNAPALSFFGNNVNAFAAPYYMTNATATSILTQFSSTAQGVVPAAPETNIDYYLNATGGWTIPSGSSGADTNYIVNSGGGLVSLRGSSDTLYSKTDSAGYGMILSYSPDSAIYFRVDTTKITVWNDTTGKGTNTLVTTTYLNNQSYLKNITGLVTAGTNVTVTGSGTSGSPYVINSTGGSGGTDSATLAGFGILINRGATYVQPRVDTSKIATQYDVSLKETVFAFNVLDSGADPTGVANSTTAIQKCLSASHAQGGGVVLVPPGTYLVNKLVSWGDTRIQGSGYTSTFLRSATADTMIVINELAAALADSAWSSNTNTLISDIHLNCHGLGTIALATNRVANFVINRVFFDSAVTYGWENHNSLIGSVKDCYFSTGSWGVYAYSDGGNLATTDVKFDGCVFVYFTKHAVEWSQGGLLNFNGCDLEVNGANGDTTTGCIYFHNNTWQAGLTVTNSWLEQNWGTDFDIENNVSNDFQTVTSHNFYGIQDLGRYPGGSSRAIYLSGPNQLLTINSSSFGIDTTTYVVRGTNTSINLNSVIDYGTIITSGGGAVYHTATEAANNAFTGNNTFNNSKIGANSNYNTWFGGASFYAPTSVTFSTAMGYGSLSSITSGGSNSGFGAGSLQANATTSYNTAVGTYSLFSHVANNYNTAVGAYAGNTDSSGLSNSYLGYASGYTAKTAQYNTGVGSYSLYTATGSGNNSAFGYGSLRYLTTGANNLALGYQSGTSLTTGSNNVIIGGAAGTAAMNNINLISDGTGKIKMWGDSLGRIAIGSTTPNTSALLDVQGTTGSLLPPRLNTTQMNAISSPAAGSLIWNSDSSAYFSYNGSAWGKIGGSGGGGGGTTTNSLTFNSSGGAAPGTTFNGSAAIIASYATVGAQAALQTGTLSTRMALTPTRGQYFYQTDQLIGLWQYSGYKWLYHGDDLSLVINESFFGPNSNIQFATGTTGTGSSAASSGIDQVGNCSSVMALYTGTTSTGYGSFYRSVNGYNFLDTMAVEYRVRVPQNLGTSTDTAKIQIGSALFSDGVYFQLDPALNSNQWQCITKSGGTATTVNTSVGWDANYHTFDIVNNGSYASSAAGPVYFYIDGVLVATITSNNPYNTGIGQGCELLKRTGTTGMNAFIDYVKGWALANY